MVTPIDVHIGWGCFCSTIAELSHCDRDQAPAKAKIFTIQPFTESLLIPSVKEQGSWHL